MYLTLIRKVMLGGLGMLLLAVVACWRQTSPPAPSAVTLTTVAHWGALAPTVWPSSNQVMMTPTVMDLGLPGGVAQVVFISFDTMVNGSADRNGVLRVIDPSGNEIARFPDTSKPPVAIPASCSAFYPNLNTVPHLSPISGVALGKLLPGQPASIIGVLDDHTSNHAGIIAFQLVGTTLMPQWCSQSLPVGDTIPPVSAPAIAQLDPPPKPVSIVLDNKVYDAVGNLRYTGVNYPRSHTAIVANLAGGSSLPQVITGGAIYASTSTSTWTGPSVPTLLPGGGAYPAVADLDPTTQPEIVVVEPVASKLLVVSSTGALITSIALPTAYIGCGGPPMIGDVDADGKPEIGVATCSQYTVFKYNAGTLSQLWTRPIHDGSGWTTSTLLKDPSGVARIYYADDGRLWVFNGANGTVLQSLPNTSTTVIEGPIIASFDTGKGSPLQGIARLILSANKGYLGTGVPGIRIFSDPNIGRARNVWSAHTYHQTNVSNAFGGIPYPEPLSWNAPVNSYRVQQQ